ncbi:MAG: radical SAM protein [Candidatus Brennerbacteria bacterium]|nr:radical SAM protein [Candidatus Brennerbacteria bacterium]
MALNLNVAYTKSPFVQAVLDGDSAVIWHSLFGYPRVVPVETLEFLESFSEPITVRSQVGNELTDENREAIEEFLQCHFLVPEGFDDRAFLEERMREGEKEIISGSLIDYLELIMSEACNFRCTYCIHFNNLETSDRINNPKKFMRYDTAKETVDRYLEILRGHGKRVAEINFGGGEPLLAWPVIKQMFEYCRIAYGSEFEFHFSINTNASLITPDIAAILKEHRVEIASSLDGLREGNDHVRLTKSGGGTFSQIMRGFDALAQAGYPLDGIAVTVTEKNFHELDESIVDWAVTRGMKNVRIDIDVVDMVEIPIEDVVAKLMRIRRYAAARGVDVPGFWSRPAENLNGSTLESRVAFCGAVRGNSMCVGPSGNIYGCGYSTTQLGSLSEIQSFHASGTAYHRFVRDHLTGVMEMCKGCMIEGQCGGGCNITQEFARATKTVKIERMCDFYRRMTHEILREQLREATASGPELLQPATERR